MRATRRRFLQSAAGAGWLCVPAFGAAFPTDRGERALFPIPPDGDRARINPPGFAWWRAGGADSYRLLVRDSGGAVAYPASALRDPVHLPSRVLAPGDYVWDVEALDAGGTVLARRGAWRFTVPSGLPEQLWEDPKSLLARVTAGHPRYVFPDRRRASEQVKPLAEQALQTPLPVAPQYHNLDGAARRRMAYSVYSGEFRKTVDHGMSVLALAYVCAGDERRQHVHLQ